MCVPSKQKKTLSMSTPLIYLLMVGLGIFAGMSDIALFKSLGLVIADVFIRVFKCMSLPIIALSIIVTLSSYCSQGMMKTVWRRTLCYTLATTFIAAAVSFVLYLLISPEPMTTSVHAIVSTPVQQMNYFEHLGTLIPTNIFSPFLESKVISVLLLGIVFVFDDKLQIPVWLIYGINALGYCRDSHWFVWFYYDNGNSISPRRGAERLRTIFISGGSC